MQNSRSTITLPSPQPELVGKRVNELRKENQLPEVQLRILAFAANSGAWGADTEKLWSEMCEAAKGMSESADLWGWAAMSWEKHWQQRIGVTLARGRAAVLLAALRGENAMVDENVAKREVEGRWSGVLMWEQVVRLLQQQRCNVGHRRLTGRKVPPD